MSRDIGSLFKARYYVVLFPLAIAAMLIGWILEELGPDGSTLFDGVVLLGTGACLAALAVAFWKRAIARRPMEILLCLTVGAFLLLRLTYAVNFLPPDTSMGAELAEFVAWLPAYYGLLFLWFGIESGRRASIAYLGLTLLVALPAALGGQPPIHGTYALTQLYLASGVAIFVYDVLGKTLIQYGGEKAAMEHLAVTDHLTGIPNRRGLSSRLSEELSRATRYGGTFSVALIDLDRFKVVNDRYGHETGDAVLREIAGLVESVCRDVDFIGRWGGEEFLVILPEIGVNEAEKVASRIRNRVAREALAGVDGITVSIGVASFQPDDTAETLVNRADEALYDAKEKGRNRVQIADDRPSERAAEG